MFVLIGGEWQLPASEKHLLGYTFPAKWLEKTKFLTYARVYVTGADLWETSKIRDGWDPEASRTVTSYGRYPFTRNVTFGLNLTF